MIKGRLFFFAAHEHNNRSGVYTSVPTDAPKSLSDMDLRNKAPSLAVSSFTPKDPDGAQSWTRVLHGYFHALPDLRQYSPSGIVQVDAE